MGRRLRPQRRGHRHRGQRRCRCPSRTHCTQGRTGGRRACHRYQRDALTLGDLRRLVARFAGPGAALLDLMMCAAVSLMFFAFLRFDDMS